MSIKPTQSRLVIEQVALSNFRCFCGEHTAKLAPLTLVVGENSTGKTSFLALIRALWSVAYEMKAPDFKEEPYDLGSFSEIVHLRGGSAAKIDQFETEFQVRDSESQITTFGAVFERMGTAPFPAIRWISNENVSLHARQVNGTFELKAETADGFNWKNKTEIEFFREDLYQLFPLSHLFLLTGDADNNTENFPVEVSRLLSVPGPLAGRKIRTFASAPVRTRPRRTYDPSRPGLDPEGDYVPMYLADLARLHPDQWITLKKRLEKFGSSADLFDELKIKSLGPHERQPFQIEVRKRGKRLAGPWRNLIDAGYGVSQILPILTELMRRDAPSVALLQQPEVHLHPSAQAALGSLLCNLATECQVIVETHSDYLIDRIRMDIRDKSSPLTPDDVTILYFERQEIDVHIHSISIDQLGNIRGAPPGYGSFFMQESARSAPF